MVLEWVAVGERRVGWVVVRLRGHGVRVRWVVPI
jgi:hypothetical protein